MCTNTSLPDDWLDEAIALLALNHFTVPVAIRMSFHNRVHKRRTLEAGTGRMSIFWRGSLNVRPAVRSDAARSSGQRSMVTSIQAEGHR